MGIMIICEFVTKFSGLVQTSGLFSFDKSQSPMVNETPREEIYDKWVPFGGSVFRQIRGVERKPAFAVFQVPTAKK